MAGDDHLSRFPLGSVIALAALAAALRIAFTWLPNLSPSFFVVFVAGVALGARAGGAIGALSMLVTNLFLSGLHPVLLVNTPAMALVGVLGGLLGRVVNLGQRAPASRPFVAALAGLIGVWCVVSFSVLADALSWALFYRTSLASLEGLVLLGLAFNAIPAAAMGALFALATEPVLRSLRHAGLVRRARPTRARAPPRAEAA